MEVTLTQLAFGVTSMTTLASQAASVMITVVLGTSVMTTHVLRRLTVKMMPSVTRVLLGYVILTTLHTLSVCTVRGENACQGVWMILTAQPHFTVIITSVLLPLARSSLTPSLSQQPHVMGAPPPFLKQR